MSKIRTVKGVGWDVAAIGNGLYMFLNMHGPKTKFSFQFTPSLSNDGT